MTDNFKKNVFTIPSDWSLEDNNIIQCILLSGVKNPTLKYQHILSICNIQIS